ncbi:MAG: FAD:protein FMN transferase [Methylophilaceae bacterium]
MRFLFLFVSVLLLTSCSLKEPLYNTQTYVFGTLVDITIYGESDERSQAVANTIINTYNELHRRLHAWKPSEISTVNHAFSQGKTSVDVSPDIAQMIAEITTLSNRSQGAFNPAIGQLIKLWGFQSESFTPRQIESTKIQALVVQNPQMNDIVVNGNKLYSNNSSVQLDLGGYAKGYALDIGLAYLRAQKIQNALINIGGNIIALGKHGDKPWRVGIQHPRQPNAIASVDLPSDWAIGTSGDYQRYFELDGKRYCHIIDPATGYPVQGIQSVTVLIPPQKNAGVLSDVASKPIFIAESDARAAAAKAMGIAHFLIIESGKSLQVSAPMQKQLDWLDIAAEKNVKVIQLE